MDRRANDSPMEDHCGDNHGEVNEDGNRGSRQFFDISSAATFACAGWSSPWPADAENNQREASL